MRMRSAVTSDTVIDLSSPLHPELACCLHSTKIAKHFHAANGGSYEHNRNDSRRMQLQHHFLDHQSDLPAVRREHDGVPMQRQVPPKLVCRMGMGKLFDECRQSVGEALSFLGRLHLQIELRVWSSIVVIHPEN